MNTKHSQALAKKVIQMMYIITKSPEMPMAIIVAMLGEAYHLARIVRAQPYEGQSEEEVEEYKEDL